MSEYEDRLFELAGKAESVMARIQQLRFATDWANDAGYPDLVEQGRQREHRLLEEYLRTVREIVKLQEEKG